MHSDVASAVSVSCRCGRAWSSPLFDSLPLVGVQPVPAGEDGPAELLELRCCACRSTIARPVSAERGAWLEHQLAKRALIEALRTRNQIPEAAERERRTWGAWRRAAG